MNEHTKESVTSIICLQNVKQYNAYNIMVKPNDLRQMLLKKIACERPPRITLYLNKKWTTFIYGF